VARRSAITRDFKVIDSAIEFTINSTGALPVHR